MNNYSTDVFWFRSHGVHGPRTLTKWQYYGWVLIAKSHWTWDTFLKPIFETHIWSLSCSFHNKNTEWVYKSRFKGSNITSIQYMGYREFPCALEGNRKPYSGVELWIMCSVVKLCASRCDKLPGSSQKQDMSEVYNICRLHWCSCLPPS